MLAAHECRTILRKILSAFFCILTKVVQQFLRHFHVQQFRGDPLPDAQSRLVPMQYLLYQIHAMGIQLVAGKEVVLLATDGLVHLEHGVVSHPYPEVHLALATVLI